VQFLEHNFRKLDSILLGPTISLDGPTQRSATSNGINRKNVRTLLQNSSTRHFRNFIFFVKDTKYPTQGVSFILIPVISLLIVIY
jgi:hypothetical protein